ncbi:cation:proton antiporter, partial [Scytonema sp. UIC 10036]|uniref:cation:proton antiporter domain-containing protein n=1 Tax=Scytonema sp. UIC 10036 TaxID=2304196 RepID=UPI00138021F0
FLFSDIARFFSINIIFGALVSGILIGVMPPELFDREKNYIKDISLSFFIPVYFGIVGLKLNLIYHFDIPFTSFFILFTTIFQFIGTIIAAKILRKDWLSSLNLSVAMTTKGGPGIILANIAYDLRIVNETFFVTIVLTAIVTSLLAGVWFRYVLAKGFVLLG